MTRRLLLLRHGKSDWDADVDDFDRPLKGRGKRAAQRVGNWLVQQDAVPDYILASPAQRALQTARRACKAMDMAEETIRTDKRIYEAGVDDLLATLGECPETSQRVMLVGHNPGLESLIAWLARDHIPVPSDGKLVPTATLAMLAMPPDWRHLQSGCATLMSITMPADLPA